MTYQIVPRKSMDLRNCSSIGDIAIFVFKTTKGVITFHFCRVKNSLRTVFKYSKFRPIYDTVHRNTNRAKLKDA